MNRKTFLKESEYHSPLCTPVDLSLEGVLCGSFGNEGFNGMGEDGSAPSYGSGVENNGWY